MPIYEFYNEETDEYFEDILSIREKEELLKINTHIRSVPSSFAIVSGVGSIDSKTDNTWKEVLSKVSEAHPGSPLADRYSSQSIKEAKTKQIIEKHRAKWRNI